MEGRRTRSARPCEAQSRPAHRPPATNTNTAADRLFTSTSILSSERSISAGVQGACTYQRKRYSHRRRCGEMGSGCLLQHPKANDAPSVDNTVKVRSSVALSTQVVRNVSAHREERTSSGASRHPGSSPEQALLPARRGEGRHREKNRLGKPIAVSVVLIGGVGNIDSGPKALKNIPSTLGGPGTPHSGNTSIPFMRIGTFDRFQLLSAICSFQALVR